jgi:succinoglycan biosynthesis transport protein ExoP
MSQSISEDTDLDRLDVDEIKRFIRRRWTLILAVAISCAMLGLMVCLLVTPVFTATSQILLDPRKQHIFGTESAAPDGALDSSIVDSQIPIILSTRLLSKVVAKENLVDDPEFAAPVKAGMLDRVFGLFRGEKAVKAEQPSFDGIDPKLAPVILHLFNKIDVTRVAKSYVLSLSVSSRDPRKATRLANSLAQTYVEDQIDVRAKSVQQAANFFEDKLGRLRDQVRQSEQAVADYRKQHDLTTTTMDGQVTVGEQQLQDLNEKLATSSADTAEKLAKYQQATRFKADGSNLDSLPEIIRSPVITQLRTQQADLTRREADLSATYGPSYPAITQIRAQRNGMERAIQSEMKRLVNTLKNDYEVAKAREDSMRKTIGGLTDVSGGDNNIGVKLRELERTNLANKALFENFLNRAKLTQEQSTFEEPDARLISPALEPSAPSSPKTKLIVPVAGVAGLLIGLGLAALLDMLRKKTYGTPTARADAFILGRVPEISSRRGARSDWVAYLDTHPQSAFAEAIEAIEAKLAPSGGGSRVALLTSLSHGEGATSLALSLATSAAKSGKRILLIDADMERRGLSGAVGLSSHPGLGDVLEGDLSASKAVVRQPLFAVLPAGRTAFDPVAASKGFRAFLGEARGRFDLVIVDGPAFDAGPGALALGGAVDSIAIVACWEQLLRDTFIAAIDRVADHPNFSGIILNRTVARDEPDLAMAS